jgi:ABC-2 type transport system ATP-binding protein
VLTITNLHKSFGKTVAVDGVSFGVERGQLVGLLGPNGAGKTTTVSMIAGLVTPDQGTVTIGGAVLSRDADPVKRRLGLVPQDLALYDELPARANLRLFGALYGLSAQALDEAIASSLTLVGLADRAGDRVKTFSGGMKRRLNLAAGLLHDPDILLLDEPASGLDPRARVELRELLRELRSLGKTILISSHILPELEELCTSVAIIDRGQVLAQGRVTDIERRLRFGAVLRVRLLADREAVEAARDHFASDPDVASAVVLADGTIELGFRGDDAASARLLAESVGSGLPIASFARAASDLEELFLQVTAPDRAPLDAA